MRTSDGTQNKQINKYKTTRQLKKQIHQCGQSCFFFQIKHIIPSFHTCLIVLCTRVYTGDLWQHTPCQTNSVPYFLFIRFIFHPPCQQAQGRLQHLTVNILKIKKDLKQVKNKQQTARGQELQGNTVLSVSSSVVQSILIMVLYEPL